MKLDAGRTGNLAIYAFRLIRLVFEPMLHMHAGPRTFDEDVAIHA